MNLGSTVNSSSYEYAPSISADGLTLYFSSDRPSGDSIYDIDLWVTSRATTDDEWGTPMNLGPTVNSSAWDWGSSISADGLSFYFTSLRPGGYGDRDIWVATRETKEDDWGPPVNLGPPVNSSSREVHPSISSDGLMLFFASTRPGGYGSTDLWVTTRATVTNPWGTPVNLGPTVNSSSNENSPSISADGSTLFFMSDRQGGVGYYDIWQVSIISIFKAHNPAPSDGAILRDTWLNLSWSPGHTTGDSRDVYLGENSDDVAAGTGDTFQGNQASMSFIGLVHK